MLLSAELFPGSLDRGHWSASRRDAHLSAGGRGQVVADPVSDVGEHVQDRIPVGQRRRGSLAVMVVHRSLRVFLVVGERGTVPGPGR